MLTGKALFNTLLAELNEMGLPGMSATLDETQTLLKQCGYAQLYSRKKRDAVVIYGLLHGMSLFEVNDKLFCENEDTLC